MAIYGNMNKIQKPIFKNPFLNAIEKRATPGRPKFYETPEDFWNRGVQYFEKIVDEDGHILIKPALTDLALFMGFEDRSSFTEYGKKEEFKYVVKRLRAIIEGYFERQLSTQNTTGAIFWLKNSGSGWKDTIDNNQTIQVMRSEVEIIQSPYPNAKIAHSENDIEI